MVNVLNTQTHSRSAPRGPSFSSSCRFYLQLPGSQRVSHLLPQSCPLCFFALVAWKPGVVGRGQVVIKTASPLLRVGRPLLSLSTSSPVLSKFSLLLQSFVLGLSLP